MFLTSTTPIGSKLFSANRASFAPLLTIILPIIFVAYPIQRFLSDKFSLDGKNIVPKSSPSKILLIINGCFPFAIRTFPPKRVTRRAAFSFVSIPPRPPSDTPEASAKILSSTSLTDFISSASGLVFGLSL